MAAGATVVCDVTDLALAGAGKRRIEWAHQAMPVLQRIRKQFIKTQPLAGIRVSVCLHVTPETANLMIALRDGGATVALCACNPLSTRDDVAASLVKDYSISTFAIKGEPAEAASQHIAAVLQQEPHITMDDGAELMGRLHSRYAELAANVMGGIEQSSTGVMRLRALARSGVLRCPVIAVNDAPTKQLFDNHYGTGQSTIDGILRATNLLLAGMTVVIAGYGWSGRGIAVRARGLGAHIIVTEVDPAKALEALMDGHRVMSMNEAAGLGEIFITATGNKSVVNRETFDRLKDGAILCNAGHFDAEIDLEMLGKMASARKPARQFVDEYHMKDGRKIYVLGEGRLVNLASAEGHPASVMDMSFATQALSLEYLLKQAAGMERRVHPVPEELDKQVARMKLECMGIKIDRLTLEQERYMASWLEGT